MTAHAPFAATLLAIGSLALSAPALAANFSHAGGFVCGQLGATNDRILAGAHRTNFNIRNANNRAVTVELHLALSFPAADPAGNGATFTPGAATTLQSVTLQPGEAVMIDCAELEPAAQALDDNLPPYFSGILDARSRRSLQVTRTQTAGPVEGQVTSVSVTEIESRRSSGGDDDDD